MLLNKLAMGGYGAYVWSAYGITLFVFGMNLFLIAREKSTIKKRIQKLLVTKSL